MIRKTIILFFLFFSAQSFICDFVDSVSSFQEWHSIPNNASFLKLDVYLAEDSSLVSERAYFLVMKGDSKFNAPFFLVELHEKDNILNSFPLPNNTDSIDLINNSLFPAPYVLKKGLRINSYIKNRIGTYTFKAYKMPVDEIISENQYLIWEKKIVIDFESKKGVLFDTTIASTKKIWF